MYRLSGAYRVIPTCQGVLCLTAVHMVSIPTSELTTVIYPSWWFGWSCVASSSTASWVNETSDKCRFGQYRQWCLSTDTWYRLSADARTWLGRYRAGMNACMHCEAPYQSRDAVVFEGESRGEGSDFRRGWIDGLGCHLSNLLLLMITSMTTKTDSNCVCVALSLSAYTTHAQIKIP